MTLSIQRLKTGDENILHQLASEDPDFDVDGRGEPLKQLSAKGAQEFLADSSVLFWIAKDGGVIAGFLFCYLLRMRAGEGKEVLLYEIGVRSNYRRQGVGKTLQNTLETWMHENAITELWVLADNPVAVEFYKSCGFDVSQEMATYMTRSLPSSKI